MTRKTTNNSNGSGSKVDKLTSLGKSLGAGAMAFMLILSLFAGGAYADTQDAGHTVDDTFSTTTEFDAQLVSASDADTTNDAVLLDSSLTSGSAANYIGSVPSSESVEVEVSAVDNSVDLIAYDSTGTQVDVITASTTGFHTLQGTDIAEVEFNVADATGIAEVNQFTASSSAAGEVSGTVTDGSGTAIGAASVEVTDSAGTVVATVPTDSSGNYSVTSLADDTYTVSVTADGYVGSSQDVTVSSGSAEVADFSLTAADHTATFAVVDSSGNAIENATVYIYESGTDTVVVQTTTDAAGQTLIDLQDGVTYDYEVIKDGYNVPAGSVTLGADTTVDVTMEEESGGTIIPSTSDFTDKQILGGIIGVVLVIVLLYYREEN